MKILLAVSTDSDPIAVSRYIGSRFKHRNIYIDILTVLPRGRSTAAVGGLQNLKKRANQVVDKISTLLRENYQITGVFGHIEYGDPSQLILSLSKRWRSSLILIEAPKRQGMLTAIRRNGVSHQLFDKAGCSLEFVRSESKQENKPFKVLIPLNENTIDRFDIRKLTEMLWVSNSQIRLAAVMPDPYDSSRIEASPAALLKESRELARRKAVVEGKLSALCNQLTEALNHPPDIDFQICKGNFYQTISQVAERFDPALIVIQSEKDFSRLKNNFFTPKPDPMSFFAANGYSILLIRNAVDESNITGKLLRILKPALLQA